MNLFEVRTTLMQRGFYMYTCHLAAGYVEPSEDLRHFKESLDRDFSSPANRCAHPEPPQGGYPLFLGPAPIP